MHTFRPTLGCSWGTQLYAFVIGPKRPIAYALDFRKLPPGFRNRVPSAGRTNFDDTLTWIKGVTSAVHKFLEEAYPIDLPHGFSPASNIIRYRKMVIDLDQHTKRSQRNARGNLHDDLSAAACFVLSTAGAGTREWRRPGKVSLQVVRDWVIRLNAHGPDGADRPAIHGVVRWRIIEEELQRRWHRDAVEQGRWLANVMRDYFAYHAVPAHQRPWSVRIPSSRREPLVDTPRAVAQRDRTTGPTLTEWPRAICLAP